jgi:hypothetical protein
MLHTLHTCRTKPFAPSCWLPCPLPFCATGSPKRTSSEEVSCARGWGGVGGVGGGGGVGWHMIKVPDSKYAFDSFKAKKKMLKCHSAEIIRRLQPSLPVLFDPNSKSSTSNTEQVSFGRKTLESPVCRRFLSASFDFLSQESRNNLSWSLTCPIKQAAPRSSPRLKYRYLANYVAALYNCQISASS